MELRDALTQITEIRLHLARTEVFRGYRAMPVAFSGGVALLAALIQGVTISEPAGQIGSYLSLWIGAAVVSGLAAGLEMMIRARNAATPVTRELTWLAIEQFTYSGVAMPPLPRRYQNHCGFYYGHFICLDHCGGDYQVYYCSRGSSGCWATRR